MFRAGKRAFIEDKKTIMLCRCFLPPAQELLKCLSMDATLGELLGGPGSGSEAAHFVAFFLGSFSQDRQGCRLAGASSALQAYDLIWTREDLFDRRALILIHSESLSV